LTCIKLPRKNGPGPSGFVLLTENDFG